MTASEDLESAARVFDGARPRLFGIAYRMLGSVAEAEDVVQDAWLRWQGTDRARVDNPAGFLTTVVTRLALNTLGSARVRRELYVGPWLPEPVDTSADPTLGAERGEALESAVLLLLEKLQPDQRAVYVLREAFGYSYDEIAEIVQTSSGNARQLFSRARKAVGAERRARVDPASHRRLLAAFVAAAQDGDLDRLEAVLSADVVSLSDGAGIARRAARRPITGRSAVARFIAGFTDWWSDTTIEWLQTNGQASVLVLRGQTPLAVLSAATSESGIDQLHWVMAPDKLTRTPV